MQRDGRHKGCDPAEEIGARQRQAIRRRLLKWYDQNHRSLPWRTPDTNAYHHWVAEIMLQQTRVDTVIDYFNRFLTAFPTVEALASASQQQVLKQWEGLGYYKRALNLHRGAKIIAKSGGALPCDVDSLRRVPGIGEYTAAAIASMAFGKKAAAVDGNVCRVLSRLFGVTTNVLSQKGKQEITALANQLIAPSRPGDFNQAWMDLGSRLCTPRSPNCDECPLAPGCVAFQTQRTGELPVRRRDGLLMKEQSVATIILRRNTKMLVRRRPIGGIWSGLWEFPSLDQHLLTGRSTNGKVAKSLVDSLPITIELATVPEYVAQVAHRLTHRKFLFDVYFARATTSARLRAPYRWVSEKAFTELSVSTAHRRIFKLANGSMS